MVFSSLPFLFLFLTVVLLVSHILPFRFRNFFLLLANLVFTPMESLFTSSL